MKKDFIRDYITEIFKVYAESGFSTCEQARQNIYNRKMEQLSYINPEIAVRKAEAEVKAHKPFLDDISAVERTIEYFKITGKTHIIKAVQAIYFDFPRSKAQHNKISARVNRFADENAADVRTVYRWLKEARKICAYYRELSVY